MGELDRQPMTLIVGKREAGKTTEGVREIRRKLDAGTYDKVYSNIYIYTDSTRKHLDPRVTFVKYEDLYKIREPSENGIPRALLYLDQLHKYLDARQSMCARNKYMTDIMIEARQHGLDWTGTTWAKSSIDLRMRKFTPLLVRAVRMRDRFRYTFIDEEAGRLWYGDLRLTRRIDGIWWCKWFDYFDTTQVVEDIPSNWDPRTGPDPSLKRRQLVAQ